MSDTDKVNKKANGNFTSEMKLDSGTKSDTVAIPDSETKADSPPKTKRKLRINRRSYIVDSNVCEPLLTDKPVEKAPSANGCDGGADSKGKLESVPKRVISLSGLKNSSGSATDTSSNKTKDSSNIVVLKKKPITFDLDKKQTIGDVISSSADPPPKKKHKPITWP